MAGSNRVQHAIPHYSIVLCASNSNQARSGRRHLRKRAWRWVPPAPCSGLAMHARFGARRGAKGPQSPASCMPCSCRCTCRPRQAARQRRPTLSACIVHLSCDCAAEPTPRAQPGRWDWPRPCYQAVVFRLVKLHLPLPECCQRCERPPPAPARGGVRGCSLPRTRHREAAAPSGAARHPCCARHAVRPPQTSPPWPVPAHSPAQPLPPALLRRPCLAPGPPRPPLVGQRRPGRWCAGETCLSAECGPCPPLPASPGVWRGWWGGVRCRWAHRPHQGAALTSSTGPALHSPALARQRLWGCPP